MRNSELPTVLKIVVAMMLVLGQFGAYTSALDSGLDLNRPSDVNTYVDELTGFGQLEGISKTFKRVDITDDNTPFLHTQINGKKDVWFVEIRNVRLKLKSATPPYRDKYVRSFGVFLDPNTGHLLKITSTFDGNDPNMLPEPPAAVAEAQMRGSDEMYLGFPSQAPKLSFLDALDVILSKGYPGPFAAKEVYALYVLQSEMGSSPRPVWAVTLRGIPPIIPPGPRGLKRENWSPVWQRNHLRVVVDAVNGRVLSATSVPQPLPPREEEK